MEDEMRIDMKEFTFQGFHLKRQENGGGWNIVLDGVEYNFKYLSDAQVAIDRFLSITVKECGGKKVIPEAK